MPTYVYETLADPAERFEWRQGMNDASFKVHPETGVAVRRLISGGYGLMKVRSRAAVPKAAPGPASNCCPGCHD